MPFHNNTILCPVCPNDPANQTITEHEIIIHEVELELAETNYSGCGVDIAVCPRCGRTFQVSYKVDEVMEVHF